ncbi:MAG: alpha/beta hydrolase, partial [archaeon]|nr:alpha/beta hydrolase [archaeon]
MIDTEKEIKLNPKFYGNISPNNQKRWSDYINNHPVKTLTFHKKEIEYISCGSGEQTVLTFHGAMGKAILNGQAIPFFEKKYRVIAPSITNFESLDEFSEAVNMILKKEKVEKYILIG